MKEKPFTEIDSLIEIKFKVAEIFFVSLPK